MQRRVFLTTLRDGMLLLPVADLADSIASWNHGNDETVADQEHLELFLAGDVMTGRGIDQVLPYPSDPVLYEDYVRDARDYVRLAERLSGRIATPVHERYIWGDATDVWANHAADVRVVNLETSVTSSAEPWPGKGIHYRMHPRNVGCLNAAKIDCCALANNHVMDWGYPGLSETLATLRLAGIETAGAGRSAQEAARPARLSVAGKADVLVFAAADVSSGVPKSWLAGRDRGGIHLLDDLTHRSAKYLADHITSQRQHGDVVVLSIHWGGNWGYRVPTSHRHFAHYLVDRGAVDIVHGHSSHHAKSLEFYKGKLILYGCGDFVNDYEGIGGRDEFRPWLASMYFASVNTATRHIERLEIEVLRMRRFRLQIAAAGERRWLGRKLDDVSQGFGTCVESGTGSLIAEPCGAEQQSG